MAAKDPNVIARKKAEEFIRRDNAKKEKQCALDEAKELKKREKAYERERLLAMPLEEQLAWKEKVRSANKRKREEKSGQKQETQRSYEEELNREPMKSLDRWLCSNFIWA